MAKAKLVAIIREHAEDVQTVAKLLEQDSTDDMRALSAIIKLNIAMVDAMSAEIRRIESQPVLPGIV